MLGSADARLGGQTRRRVAVPLLLVALLAAACLPGPAVAQAVARAGGQAGAQAGPRLTRVAAHPRRLIGDSEYCDGCEPPLAYAGGPVMNTIGAHGVTVTPIYWAPPGTNHQFPAGYESLINGYLANVTAASGVDSNVYSIDGEYYRIASGQLSYLRYRITATAPIVVTDPVPTRGCRLTTRQYTACVTDAQLEAELSRVVGAHHLPEGLAYFYPVFFAPGVETAADDGSNSDSGYCGYHSNTDSGARQIVYSNEPYEGSSCSAGQSPNHDVAADAAIDTLSHELNEAITDPEASFGQSAWLDGTGNEIGDICRSAYGTPLGSTDPGAAQSTEYNQVINGARYYTQTEFSNNAYRHFGVGKGCQPSEATARGPSSRRQSTVASILADPYPHGLPANGRATASIYVTVGDKDRNAIAGDRIFFTDYSKSGDGTCGRLSRTAARTGADGSVTVTYHATRSNVACVIVANDALGGRSASAIVYQGRTRSVAPLAADTFPSSVRAGQRSTFTTTFTNRMRAPIGDAQVVFAIFPFDAHSPNVSARQIQLSVSEQGRQGPFVPVTLDGSTGAGEIRGVIGGTTGVSLPADRKRTLTYRVTVNRGVRRKGRQPLLSFEAYLYQVDPASGDGDVLADTLATDVRVR